MRPLAARGAAFWLLLPGVFFEGFNGLRLTGAVTVGDALILAAGLATLADAARGGTRLWLPWWVLLGLPLFITGPVIDALAQGGASHANLGYAWTLVLSLFVIPAIIASQRPVQRSPEWLLFAWVAGLVIGAGIAYLQFHRWTPALLDRWLVTYGGRIAGLNSNPNILGEGLALVTPACMALALGSRSWLLGALGFAACGLCLHVADLTGSRASIVGGACGALAVAAIFVAQTRWAELQRRLAQATLLVVAVGVFFALRTGYYESAIERLLGHTETGALSAWIRSQLAERGLHTFASAPFFGTGYGGLTYRSHNVVLALLEGGGLFGLAGFLLVQLGLAWYAVRTFVAARSGEVTLAWLAALSGVWCAWLVVGMFQFPILHRHGSVVFGLSALWLAVAQRRRESAEAAPPAPWPTGRRGLRALP